MKRFKLLILLLTSILLQNCNSPNNSTKKQAMVIGFMGDVMLGRMVNEKLKWRLLKTKDSSYPWGNVLPLLKANNLNIINLETTLTKHEEKVKKVFNFKSDPKNVQTLIDGNIHVVSLANNHSLDFHVKGLVDTIETLDANGIKHVGAGTDISAAKKPVIIEEMEVMEVIKIGILGYTDNEPGWLATENKPGINYIKIGDIENVKKDIYKIRDKVDILIATIHWGPNMRQTPSQEFINFAHQMIDNGIDIIHGHSAHIFQGIEIYKNKVIMYDTGNFVDDYRVNPYLRNDQSFLFRIRVDKKTIKSIELIPVMISNMQVNVGKKYEGTKILEKMKYLSKQFKTNVEIKNNIGHIKITN